MMDRIFLICISYAIIRMLFSARAFFQLEGGRARFIALLLLTAITCALWYAAFFPGLDLLPRSIRLICIVAGFVALAIVSRKSALAIRSHATDQSRDGVHACNAMLLASVVAVVIVGLSGFIVLTGHLFDKMK